VPEDLGSSEAEGVNFNFKARPAANGVGLQEDAILTRANFQASIRSARVGSGASCCAAQARSARRDPDRVVLGGRFSECDLIARCESVATVPAEVFAPYHHGRHDDWSVLDTESAALVAVG